MRFLPGGKRQVAADNLTHHGRQACENCGIDVVQPQKSARGVTPPSNEWQTDHIIPSAKRGNGDPSNGDLLCRDCNRAKSDK